MGRARNRIAAAATAGGPNTRGATATIEKPRVETYTPLGTHGVAVDGAMPDYDGLLIEFPRDMMQWEKEQTAGATAYWAFKPYVSDGSDENRWLSDRHLWIDASSYRSRSKDWRARNVFDELEEYLREGTPARKSDGERKWQGVETPKRFILGHPGDTAPPLPPEPLDFSRDREVPTLSGLTDPRDLLRFRG